MAKKQKQEQSDLSPEEIKEQEELKKRFEEKEKKKKEQAKALKKKEKAEIKRIKAKINFPYKLLLFVSLLITLFAFIILFFGAELPTLDSLYYTFMVFTAAYLGGGSIMLLLFYLVSEEKIVEIKKSKEEKENLKKEEIRKEEEEFAKLVQAEKDFASRKMELHERNKIELEKSEEAIKEHVLEFEEEQQQEDVMELEAPKQETIDPSTLPDVNLEGIDLGFTDYNNKTLETSKPTQKVKPVIESSKQEYTLDDLNFDFDAGSGKNPIDIDLK